MEHSYDCYGMFYEIDAAWSTIPIHFKRPEEPDGFYARAIHPSLYRKEYLIALAMVGLEGRGYQTHCICYRRYMRSLGVALPDDFYKGSAFLDEAYLLWTMADHSFTYHPNYPSRVGATYGTLEDHGLDAPTLLTYWRENLDNYTIPGVEFHPDGRVKYFTYVDSETPYYIAVPVTKVTLSPTKKVEHAVDLTLSVEQQALAVAMDTDKDGAITSAEIVTVDADNDHIVTSEEVQHALNVTQDDFEKICDDIIADLNAGKTVVEPILELEVPEGKTVPTTEAVMARPNYNPEYSLQLNFAAALLEQMFDGQEIDFLQAFMTTLTTFSLLGIVKSAKLMGTALQNLWKRFKINGQPQLTREDFVDKGLLTDEQFDIIIEEIDEREKLLATQESYFHNLLVNADRVNVDTQMNSINDSNPLIEELLETLTQIERTYVRL